MEALQDLDVAELKESLMDPPVIAGEQGFGFSQYTLWMIIILILVLLVVFLVGKRLKLVPTSKFVNMVEYGYELVRGQIAEGAIGHGYKKHVPFLASLFFFILIANFVGLIPGCRTPTGTISVTWALSLISFVYFNYWGVKTKGGLGYIKSIAPSGLPKPLVPVIWVFETISLILRALTLAVRLFGNMFAGHMVLGIFAMGTSAFLTYGIQTASVATAAVGIVPFLLLFVMYALECLVAFLQAYVFTVLSAVYISLATSEH